MKKFMIGMATAALAMTLSAMSFAQQDQSAPSNSQPTSDMQNGQQTNPEQQGTQPSSQSPDSSSSMQNSQGMQNAAGSTFTGMVVKAGSKYVLKTADSNYQLDDQDKAKQFVGQQVKINGNLDSSTSMIHISDISPTS
jgi:Protein of unknown function (DUF5818)